MFIEGLARHLIRLYRARLLSAISSIGIVRALVSLLAELDKLDEASEHALLLILPVSGYQLGKTTSA